jgi:hypothetical protein
MEDGDEDDSHYILAHKKFITEVISHKMDSLQLSSTSTAPEKKAVPIYSSRSDTVLPDGGGNFSISPPGRRTSFSSSNNNNKNNSHLRQMVVSDGKSTLIDGTAKMTLNEGNVFDLNVTHSSSSSSSEDDDSFDMDDSPSISSLAYKSKSKKKGSLLHTTHFSSVNGGSGALVVSPGAGHKTLPSTKKVSPARMRIMKQLLKRYQIIEGDEEQSQYVASHHPLEHVAAPFSAAFGVIHDRNGASSTRVEAETENDDSMDDNDANMLSISPRDLLRPE